MITPLDDPDDYGDDLHRPGGRTMQCRWTLGVTEQGWEIQALLVVTHRRAPHRAYLAALWTVERGFVERHGNSYLVDSREGRPDPFPVLRRETPRFSRKGAEAARAEALAVLRGRAMDPQVARYFDVNNRVVQA